MTRAAIVVLIVTAGCADAPAPTSGGAQWSHSSTAESSSQASSSASSGEPSNGGSGSGGNGGASVDASVTGVGGASASSASARGAGGAGGAASPPPPFEIQCKVGSKVWHCWEYATIWWDDGADLQSCYMSDPVTPCPAGNLCMVAPYGGDVQQGMCL